MKPLLCAFLFATLSWQSHAAPAWVEASNQHAKVLLDIQARFSPESAASLGISGLDEQVLDLKPQLTERMVASQRTALTELERRLAAEKDPLVRQDLEIMVEDTRQGIRGLELSRKYQIPYVPVPQLVFGSMRGLLDDQIAAERRPAALVRLRKYAGLVPDHTPLTQLAEQRTRERLNEPGLLAPFRDRIEKDLQNTDFFLQGIEQLFTKYKVEGYQEPLAKFKEQVAAYNAFLRKDLLPKARTDFKLPPELYAFNLEQTGVDIAPEELIRKARTAYNEIQAEMQALAPKVAKAKGLSVTDYREVIRELKKEQLAGAQILDHYKTRIGQIEDIIRKQELVSLPNRPARMRLATPAESAGQPAPHMRPPRLIGNTGESGEFVLPLVTPSATGEDKKMDDFTYAAASWTLTAHEARPGHELQFSGMAERGISLARAVFASNSVNIEGWGLYAEKIVLPYMPPEGQLISLNMRLLRAARAFLDPELHLGKISREQAYKILREDVNQSDAMATQEVDRYTFRAPAQATSYYYGYSKMVDLRKEVEQALGPKFNPREFHDFVLSQGLLPPNLLRKAVLERFRPN
jgi:hypothetical protein